MSIAPVIDWDKALGVCPCGHGMHADHLWIAGPGGSVRWCRKCRCWHAGGPAFPGYIRRPCLPCGERPR